MSAPKWGLICDGQVISLKAMEKKTLKKDQLGIIAENINSKFGLVIEGVSVLTKKMGEMSKKIDRVDERLGGQIEEVKEQIKEVDERLSDKIDKVSEQVQDLSYDTNSKFETVFNYLSANEPKQSKIKTRLRRF